VKNFRQVLRGGMHGLVFHDARSEDWTLEQARQTLARVCALPNRGCVRLIREADCITSAIGPEGGTWTAWQNDSATLGFFAVFLWRFRGSAE